MLKKLFAVSAVGLILGLASCSTVGDGENGADNTNPDNNGVQTSGLGENMGLDNPNAKVPGADQKYYFEFDQSTVRNTDLPSIKIQAQYLIAHTSATAKLEGNTDVRGSREYNLALGQRRADAVEQALLLNGASKTQLSTISYGAEKPVARGNSDEDYAQNRRVDMKYRTKIG